MTQDVMVFLGPMVKVLPKKVAVVRNKDVVQKEVVTVMVPMIILSNVYQKSAKNIQLESV